MNSNLYLGSIGYNLDITWEHKLYFMKGDEIWDNPLVAYDGSPHSLMILEAIDDMRALLPRVNILHVHNSKKVYLAQRTRGPAVLLQLKARYPEDKCSGYSIELKDNAEKTTNLIILESMVAKSASILFLGFVGSKGVKPRACDLSSRIRQFVYESKFHLAILKQPPRVGNKVLFLLDGSQTSLEGLTNAIAFSKRFNKSLTVLHAYNFDLTPYAKHVKLILRKVQQERPDYKFEVVLEEGDLLTSVQSRIDDYEWVLLNKNGQRGSTSKQRFVGSKASLVLEQVDCNLILFN